MKLSSYESNVIDDIARHIIEPSAVATCLALAGKPVEKLLEMARNSKYGALNKIGDKVQSIIEKVFKTTIKMAVKMSSDEKVVAKYQGKGFPIRSHSDIRGDGLDLEHRDTMADRFDYSNAAILGCEGAVMGCAATLAEGIPGAQILIPSVVTADVVASMTFLSRHVCQVASAYGYSPNFAANIPHVLAAMAPQTDSSDEGYLMAKAAALEAVRDAGKVVAKGGGRQLGQRALQKEAPLLIRLIRYVAQRLGLVITQKELGMLVPVAGAGINCLVNVAFQQTGHTAAKDYFRILVLSEKYAPANGADCIDKLVRGRVEELKREKKQGKVVI